MAVHLIQEAQAKGSRVTFVVDGISLAEQTSARLSSYGIEHGYAQGLNTWGRREKIQVAMAQTIEKREFWTDLDLLIVDECFVAGTPIRTPDGDMPIESLSAGDAIDTALGVAYVTATSVQWTHEIYSVRFDNGTRIRCTGKHPFFTSDGWVEARSLGEGSRCFRPQDVSSLRGDISPVPSNKEPRTEMYAKTALGEPRDLFSLLCHEAVESDGQPRSTRTHGKYVAEDRAWTSGTGWQRARHDLPTSAFVGMARGGLDAGIHNDGRAASSAGLSLSLQDRSGTSSTNDCDRGGRSVASRQEATAGPKEGQMLGGARVVSVSRTELIRSVPVFNIQVSRHPTYYAGGILVHNCHIQRKQIQKFAREWGGTVIGLTATPIVKGLRETWETVVNATTTDALVADGYLAPVEIYAATEIDMQGAAKTAGEWTAGAVRERGGRIIGDIVSTWSRYTTEHFGGPAKTLLFSSDIPHGADLCQAFQAAGHDFRQSTYLDSSDVTTSMVKGFRRGEFTGLVSVSKFVKGFDVPDVLIGVDARPNSSSLHEVMQKVGRVMRSSPGKEKALWLCFAGNMAGWYEEIREIWANGVSELPEDSKPAATRKEGKARQDVVCFGCGFVQPPGAEECPSCGKARVRRSKTETVPGRMERVDSVQHGKLPEWAADREWVWQQVSTLALQRKARRPRCGSTVCCWILEGYFWVMA